MGAWEVVYRKVSMLKEIINRWVNRFECFRYRDDGDKRLLCGKDLWRKGD